MPFIVHPLLEPVLAAKRRAVAAAFPTLDNPESPGVLAAYEYLVAAPQRFYDRSVFQAAFTGLLALDEAEGDEFRSYLKENAHRINLAFSAMAKLNALASHDDVLDEKEEYRRALDVSQHLHPAYVEMVEAVLTSLARVFAHFSRHRRGKLPDGLDAWSISQELSRTDLSCLFRSYNHTVRNGIAHGNVLFRDSELRYTDKKGNTESISVRDVVRMFDDMVDVCNALMLAYKLFYAVRSDLSAPLQHVVAELFAQTESQWWRVDGCYESLAIPERTQLNVHAVATTSDPNKIQHAVWHTGLAAEVLAPAYDRYFVAWRAKEMLPGFAAFDGRRLRECRVAGLEAPEAYASVLETYMLAPLARERVFRHLRRLENLAASFAAAREAQHLDSDGGSKSFVVRSARGHRNAWGTVVDAQVVLAEHPLVDLREVVRTLAPRILAAVRSAIVPKVGSGSLVRFLPMAFCRIAVFAQDYRVRRLRSFGLGEDLIGTIQLCRMSRIRAPDILNAEIEYVDGLRIAWNRAWTTRTSRSTDGADKAKDSSGADG